MTTKLIAFVGLIGSGKDTCADYLVKNHGFKKESFAKSLKDAVSSIFGWDREMLEGATPESREWREQVDEWWAQRLGISNLTPRFILQNWGTEVIRHHFHDDIWVASLENRIRQGGKFVISDCRFPNELKVIKNYGGQVIRVKRGPEPDWWRDAIDASLGGATAMITMRNRNIHITEWGWASLKFDAVIENDGSVSDLYEKLKNLVQ